MIIWNDGKDDDAGIREALGKVTNQWWCSMIDHADDNDDDDNYDRGHNDDYDKGDSPGERMHRFFGGNFDQL